MSTRNGYVCIYAPEHHRADSTGMVYEHILLAEEMLGRNLKSKEVVHHEDRCRKNNKKENLYVFSTNSDHARYHKTGQRTLCDDGAWTSPKIKRMSNCKQCEKIFEKKEDRTVYCSDECSRKSRRKVDRPSKEELSKKLFELKNFEKAAEIFGVSSAAVRKWCKYYDISNKASDYK